MKHLSRFRIVILLFSLAFALSTIWAIPSLTTAQDNDPAEAHKEIARRVFEDLWNGGNLDSAIDIYAPNSTLHAPNGSKTLPFYPTWWRDDVFPEIHDSFPDLELTIDHILAEEDLVAVHYSARGTFENDTTTPSDSPLYATGEEATWDGLTLYRFEDGRIAEVWWYWDNSLFAKADVCEQ
jgi:ketosteroid isomerase-like protein